MRSVSPATKTFDPDPENDPTPEVLTVIVPMMVFAGIRRSVKVAGDPDIVGGVKGSFPINGDYGRFEYLNWAAKFFVDANLLELTFPDLRSH